MRQLAQWVLALHLGVAQGFSLRCALGAECLASQDTQIPAKVVQEALANCDDFTRNNIGAAAVRLSYKELQERTGGRLTPLARAWHAYDYLHGSPLKFTRPRKSEDLDYGELWRACKTLERDARDADKWSK